MPAGTLVVIRGNSGSGKSTVAAELQQRFDRGTCAVVPQDVVRRNILREPDEPGRFNIDLIAEIAGSCLARGLIVVVEGILNVDRYGAMLEQLANTANHALFYRFDLTLDETLIRHAGRPLATEVPESMIREWYRGWQPLPFIDELRIGVDWTRDAIVDRIQTDILALGRPRTP